MTLCIFRDLPPLSGSNSLDFSSPAGAGYWWCSSVGPPPPAAALCLAASRLTCAPCCLQDQLQQKIVCPGVVTCLSASPDGLYLIAAVADALYLWEVRTAP